ncbi:tRNA 2-thiouridine synthesizing protein A [Sanguibacter gelidistatuariae]|uniref:tRNA 2-thiouridine synthesizing protein A n=1 Tax=Sanguibacter gelidistatuariae TaxID=1814289 RepID=A0A1G6RA52_9MICO|nr:sulfurtransferase TusA family protein [Sanguibacter gelidistatuariae]SDD01502.1 tRNA 2-thiouridine synthesizing protein A [Sanguibacter gelidistatuariae]
MTGEEKDRATVVDARGLRCPIPVIRLARQAQSLADGDRVTVWSTDPAAVYDVPAWARMRGHTIEESIDVDADDGPFQAITVRIGG